MKHGTYNSWENRRTSEINKINVFKMKINRIISK